MANLRPHFQALLKKVNPDPARRQLAESLPADVRKWLADCEFTTKHPHTRLSGSYKRHTAILDINDVDVLLFLPDDQAEETPSAVLAAVKKVLLDYPDTSVSISPQRRSVHLDFEDHEFQLDIVPAVAVDGLDKPLEIPDKPAGTWIDTDPLGYGSRLSQLNQDQGDKVVPLIKLIKAWRNAQMIYMRPKSYVLEVMMLYAVENGDIDLEETSLSNALTQFFEHIRDKYEDLMDNGSEQPRIPDPQVTTTFITRGWKRTHFESFMRRVRTTATAARKAESESDVDTAADHWKGIYGDLWPTDGETQAAAKAEARLIVPGTTPVTSAGGVIGFSSPATIRSRPTKYHGAK
jgi:hypothetical protein